jgi:hypothetical protein
MCPCTPSFSLTFGVPGVPGLSGLNLPALPFCVPAVPAPGPVPPGQPHSLPTVAIAAPDFPDLAALFGLKLSLPSGDLHAAISIGDIFDAIISMMDQFMPFLMLYKFFLPILNIIVCIIEVLCSLLNPFALVGAIDNLFSVCIPAFLNLFPIFALIIMIVSIILLLIMLIEYILCIVIKFSLAISGEISALITAFTISNATGILAIVSKIGIEICALQNLLVLLSFFGIIVAIIKDILGMLFAIPPCEGGDNSQCCNPQFCPEIVQQNYTRTTGTFQYLNEVGVTSIIPIPDGYFNIDLRTESWQLYDTQQTIPQEFWNIVEAFDVIADGYVPPVFFPTASVFTATTPPRQAAYTVDLRVLYNPSAWGRTGPAEHIRFTDCIVLFAPIQAVENFDNTFTVKPTGVFFIAGGLGFKDDGKTKITGFAPDGITPISAQATLNNFLHKPAVFSAGQTLTAAGEVIITDMEYTFKPNQPVLMQANLITLGCEPNVALNRAFINNVLFSNVSTQTNALKTIVNSPTFPDPNVAQECMLTALTGLQLNMTPAGLAEFQAVSTLCMTNLQNNCNTSLTSLVGAGFNACKSTFTLSPSVQFTTLPIVVSVNINENNGLPITANLPISVGDTLAKDIVPFPTFGKVGPFTYDGYQAFTAELTSETPGSGELMVSFQNQVLCVNTLPTATTAPSHVLQALPYQFVYAPYSADLPGTGEGDTVGRQPRRNPSDVSKNNPGST